MKFKKKIIFRPAYDRRHPDPKKDYGIHGVECWFYLIGEKGVVQFKVYTQWMLPHVQQEHDDRCMRNIKMNAEYSDKTFEWNYHPKAWDIGYHSPVPLYEGQTKMERCDFFEGGCYYDGSSTAADEYLEVLIAKGSKAIWKKMKEYYRNVFEKPAEEKTVGDAGFGELISAVCKGLKEST